MVLWTRLIFGDHQQSCIDYFETFSPVFKPTTVRLVLTIVVSFKWSIRQLDVKNCFIDGFLHEKVYMCQPLGFVHPSKPTNICRLRKSIYGLKQAHRAWFSCFSNFLLSIGFKCSSCDTFMFTLKVRGHLIVLLLIFEDIVFTGSSSELVQKFIYVLSSQFAMNDLGDLHHFLGV